MVCREFPLYVQIIQILDWFKLIFGLVLLFTSLNEQEILKNLQVAESFSLPPPLLVVRGFR